jgi:2,4-dienoyl-CoA reductase-like NADH-dependent reductase (Old Yellow Enzyme family)
VVHAAHGYLLHEFLSPLSNRRGDGYGGDLERRARLLREIVRTIRGRHTRLPILVRISATEWVEGGFDLDEAERVVSWLAEDGADLVDVSSGGNVPVAPIPVGPAYQTPLAARLRGSLPAEAIAVGTVGLITEAAQAESILVTGQADVVFLGRALLADPHLPLRWAHELRAPSAEALVPPQYHRARF